MSRTTGIFNFAANFEVLAKAPLDAKQLVGTYADLTTPSTWNGSGNVWLYNGAVVAVGSDLTPSNNGIYWLCDATNYTSASSWVKAGSGSVTGATNGLHMIGSSVALGGTLTTGTTINANSKIFSICNACSILISSNGVGCSTSISGYNSQICGTNSASIISPQVSLDFSTIGLIRDSAGTPRGLQYNGNYRSTFLCNSLVDAAYVTGKSNVVNVYCQAAMATYTATCDSEYIGAQCGSVICLPASPKFGQQITISDVSGFALNCLIVVCGNGRCINGADCATINTDYGSVTVVNNTVAGACGWSAIAFVN